MLYDYVAIVGENNSGKSTFARALAGRLGWQMGETSGALRAPLARILHAALDGDRVRSAAMIRGEMIEYPERYRAAKRALGDELCAIDPGALVEKCIAAGARVVCGMRRPEEVTAMVSGFGFRVSGPGGSSRRTLMVILYRPKPGETAVAPASTFLALQVPLLEILNEGSIAELEATAGRVAAMIRGGA